MKRELKVVVTIDKTPMTEKEKKIRLAQFFLLLHKWKYNQTEF